MTSCAFVFSALPLLLAKGAGAAARHSVGASVVGGMSVATTLGVFLIPVLYVAVSGLGRARREPSEAGPGSDRPPDEAASPAPSTGTPVEQAPSDA